MNQDYSRFAELRDPSIAAKALFFGNIQLILKNLTFCHQHSTVNLLVLRLHVLDPKP